MTEQNNKNFLEKIKFSEDFLPFKKDAEITFGGEKEVQQMIEFYLKTVKKINPYDKIENAKRFKINCVVGNNGSGKSRLYEWIYNSYKEDTKKIIILDDFFILSKLYHISVNYDLVSRLGQDKFLVGAYNFLSENKTINNIFAKFVSEKLNSQGFLDFSLELSFTIFTYVNRTFPENLDLLLKLNKTKSGITDKDFKNFCDTILSKTGFGFTVTDARRNYPNIVKLLKDDETFFYVFLSFSGILGDLLKIILFKNELSIDSRGEIPGYWFNHYILFLREAGINGEKSNLLENIISLYEILKGDVSNINGLSFKEFIKGGPNNIFNNDIPDILFTVYDKIKNGYKKIYHRDNIKFTEEEIKLLGENFNADLNFESKKFSDLSAGEKTILSRFTNIYKNIDKESKFGKTDFIILIDEPDLHLHLDWQRQYIQRLIDVFSTLPSEINFHFIIATHSPFIISDLPKESLVLLQNGEPIQDELKTFGANYVDLIKHGFFFENKILMGSFAEENINNLAIAKRFILVGLDKINQSNLDENEMKIYEYLENNKDEIDKMVEQIGDSFLRENLLYL